MLREVFQSGRPLTYVRTAEEQRIGKVLREVGRTLHASAPVPVWTWSLTQGFLGDDGTAQTGTLEAREALDFIASDFHARVIQHENDHLNGEVYLDRMPNMRSLAHLAEWHRFALTPEEQK